MDDVYSEENRPTPTKEANTYKLMTLKWENEKNKNRVYLETGEKQNLI